MRQVIVVIAVASLLWVTLSASVAAGDKAVDLAIVYSNNVGGQIEPCPS
jgi:hypothetical protein